MTTILDILKQEAIDADCDPTTLRIEHINNYSVSAYAHNISTGKEEITSGRIRHEGNIYVNIRYDLEREISY